MTRVRAPCYPRRYSSQWYPDIDETRRGTTVHSGQAGQDSSADTFTREVIRNKLLAIASEMGIVLARTSMSPIVYEVLDFA